MLNRNIIKKNVSRESLSSVIERLREASEASSRLKEGRSPEEKQEILRQRAWRLSEAVSEPEAENLIEVIEFTLSGETYAIETSYLKEVFHMREITPVPLTPPFVKGVVNLRGSIISVLDIKVFFELPNGAITNYDRVIILQDGGMTFGILADEIKGITKLSLDNSSSSLSDFNEVRQKYLKTVTSGRTVILDGGKLLNDRSIIINDEI
ncbi:MAG: chemotaxis protein CheW [archaeon]